MLCFLLYRSIRLWRSISFWRLFSFDDCLRFLLSLLRSRLVPFFLNARRFINKLWLCMRARFVLLRALCRAVRLWALRSLSFRLRILAFARVLLVFSLFVFVQITIEINDGKLAGLPRYLTLRQDNLLI